MEEQVLGLWVGHQDVNHLSQPITITFRRPPNARTDDGRCVFWDESNENWSSEGCVMSNQTEEEFVCSCNHLSFFAVMLVGFFKRNRPPCDDDDDDDDDDDEEEEEEDVQHLNPETTYESVQPSQRTRIQTQTEGMPRYFVVVNASRNILYFR
ncbi:adhesion G-protein coupled receptor G1-like [Engraulis encrasicolus]|uniref:adhesion G-protein coupled receptor G1-like n=1 Tax=Engraulis encrasicolus TaxID=184585 RepID=UPI002FD33D34